MIREKYRLMDTVVGSGDGVAWTLATHDHGHNLEALCARGSRGGLSGRRPGRCAGPLRGPEILIERKELWVKSSASTLARRTLAWP